MVIKRSLFCLSECQTQNQKVCMQTLVSYDFVRTNLPKIEAQLCDLVLYGIMYVNMSGIVISSSKVPSLLSERKTVDGFIPMAVIA